jgi:hypothetical protein
MSASIAQSKSTIEHPNNNSPIRKQLAKRIINYYDQLAQSRELDRSRSRSKERSKSKERLSQSKLSASKLGDSKLSASIDPEVETYEDTEHRKVKLTKLKELMKTELSKAHVDGALDPDYQTLTKLHPGYPTFMKELETPEHMLEDKHNTNLKVVLESKVDAFQHLPDDEPYVEEQEEDFMGPDNRLYHIVTRKSVTASNKAQETNFDFHQRKAKEIRRLQYAANMNNPKPVPKPVTIYPVWVLVNGKPVPGNLASEMGFKLDSVKKTLVINENENVSVKPKDDPKPKYDKFSGDIKKPTSTDPDCDFVVLGPSGERVPILVSLRPEPIPAPVEKPKTRYIAGANSTILDAVTNQKIGRAKSDLTGKDALTNTKIKYSKGIFLDSDNDLSIVLFKRLNQKECMVKKTDQSQDIELIEQEESVDLGDGLTATKITLAKKPGDKSPFAREVYLYPNSFFLQPLRIFDNEFIVSECENCLDYHGKTEWRKEGKKPEDEKLYIHFETPEGKRDTVRVVLDEAHGMNDIADKFDYLTLLARRRYEDWLASLKKKRRTIEFDELRFDVVDKRGRKLKVLIKNDSDNEAFSDSEDEGEDLPLENAYYHLGVEEGKVVPFRRRTREQRASEDEKNRRSILAERDALRQFEVKIEGAARTFEDPVLITKAAKTKQNDSVRADLGEIAKSLGITFANEYMFESFVQFMRGLPSGADERRAALQYKSLMGDISKK